MTGGAGTPPARQEDAEERERAQREAEAGGPLPAAQPLSPCVAPYLYLPPVANRGRRTQSGSRGKSG